MESIPELKRRLANARLRQQHREGRNEAKRLKREIRELEHPYFHSLNVGIKQTGRHVGKNLKYIGKTTYKAVKERGEAISRSNGSSTGHSNFARHYKSRPVKMTKYQIKKYKRTHRHRKHYGSKVKYRPKVKRHSSSGSSGYNFGGSNFNPMNLDF